MATTSLLQQVQKLNLDHISISNSEAQKALLTVPATTEPNLTLVRASHLRVRKDKYCNEFVSVKSYKLNPHILNAYGGATVATFRDEATGKLYTGVSLCSKKDTYHKKRGLIHARNRANYARMNNRYCSMPEARFVIDSEVARLQIVDEVLRQNPKAFFDAK